MQLVQPLPDARGVERVVEPGDLGGLQSAEELPVRLRAYRRVLGIRQVGKRELAGSPPPAARAGRDRCALDFETAMRPAELLVVSQMGQRGADNVGVASFQRRDDGVPVRLTRPGYDDNAIRQCALP